MHRTSAGDGGGDSSAGEAPFADGGGQWVWTSESYPADAVSLRSISSDNFVVVNTTGEPAVIGETDFNSGPSTLHPKAIYLVEGKLFQVEKLDFEGRKAFVREIDCDYYTDAITYTRVTILDTFEQGAAQAASIEQTDQPWKALPSFDVTRSHGEVHVVSRVVGFKKIKFYTNENVGSGELDLPEQQMHTTSYWLTIPADVMAALPYAADDRRDGVVGLASALRQVAQLLLMCDRHDIGISIDTGDEMGRTPRSLRLRQLPGRHRLQPAAVPDAPDIARRDAQAHRRVQLRERMPWMRRTIRQYRPAGEGGGPSDSRPAPREDGHCGHPGSNRMNLSDRLRGILETPRASAERSSLSRMSPAEAPGVLARDTLEQTLGGEWRQQGGARCFVVERRSQPDATCGGVRVAEIARSLACAATQAPLLTSAAPALPPFLFFDVETTGLSGGAGTCAFLVGCAWFCEDGAFLTRQYVLASHRDERPMLESVAGELARAGALVTFNGKSFDAPVLEMRYMFHRLQWPGARLPHLDVLHPARLFWGTAPARQKVDTRTLMVSGFCLRVNLPASLTRRTAGAVAEAPSRTSRRNRLSDRVRSMPSNSKSLVRAASAM